MAQRFFTEASSNSPCRAVKSTYLYSVMALWQFIILVAVVIFILFNAYLAIKDLGDIGDD